MKLDGDLKRIKNIRWEITERGLRKLRSAFSRLLRDHLPYERVDSILSAKDEMGDELLLAAMKRVPIDVLDYILLASQSRHQLFALSVGNITPGKLGGFFASGHAEFRSLIVECGAKLRRLYDNTPTVALTAKSMIE